MTFGERLLELLEERDISQKKFASALNIAPTTLNGYIKNRSQPDFELVKTIADMLNVSTDFLLDYKGQGVDLSVKELSVILKLRTFTKEQRQVFYDLVDITSKYNK